MTAVFRQFWILCFVLPAVVLGEPVNPVKQAIQQEITVLSSCGPGKCPVFYVSALGRKFPIPGRYRKMAPDDATPELTSFVSPAPEMPEGSVAAGKALVGRIVIGPWAKLREADGLVLRRISVTDDVETFALSLAESPDTEIARVLVAQEQFVQIGDMNPRLAELLLKLSAR
jgi:hypothetical protein